MAGWTKKNFQADPVTEFIPGPNLGRLQASLSGAVILALDVSGSMSGDRLVQAKRGCHRFIDEAVAENYSVGVILWHHGVSAFTPPNRSPRHSRNMIESASASGGNDIVPCLQDAHAALMAAPAGDRVVAVFGDGDLGNPRSARDAASVLITDGIRILTCGLGEESAAQLDVISTETVDTPRAATSESIAESIASMASGLVRKASVQS